MDVHPDGAHYREAHEVPRFVVALHYRLNANSFVRHGNLSVAPGV